MNEKKTQGKPSIVNDAIIKNIRDAVGTLDYGVVTIKVHEFKIVQSVHPSVKKFELVWMVLYQFIYKCLPCLEKGSMKPSLVGVIERKQSSCSDYAILGDFK